MEKNLDEASLVAHNNKAPGQKEQGHSANSTEVVIEQKNKGSEDSKHSGSGDGCEVCSSTSADLVVGVKVGSDTRKEIDMETECGALGAGGGDTLSNSFQEDSNCSTSSGNPDMTSTPDATSSLKADMRSKLRKDDSGICVRESLTSDDSKCEDEEAAARTGSGRPSLPSVSTESEGLVADILDSEESDSNAIPDQESDSNAPSGTQGHCSDMSDAANGAAAGEGPANRTSDIDVLNQSDSSDVDVIRLNTSRQRRRRHTRSSSSSNSSSSASSSTTSGPDERNSDDDDDDDEDDNPQDMEVDMSTMPHDPWRVIPEIRSRENGCCNRMPSARTFCQRVGASLKFVQRLELQNKLEHHEGCVNALNFNKSGTLLASGSDDLNVVIWNWAEKVPYLVFDSGHRSNVFQCKFMPYSGDTHIVTCARDGYVRLAELSSTGVCKGTKKLALHRSAAHKLALLQDSSHVFYSCGEDALVYEIDLRQEKPNKLSVTKENDKKVALYSISSNPFKSHEYCVGGRDHFIRIYDKRMISENSENGIVKKFCPHHLVDHNDIKANVTCAVYNYNGTEVLGTYNDEDIYLFDNSHSDGAEYVHRYTGHRNNSTVKGVNFYGPKSEYIISGSDCSNVFLWEKESEKIVQYFHADEGGVVNVLEPHPHAPILATSGLDSDVKIWAPTAQEPTVLKGLKKVMRQNERERSNERSNEPEMIDSQMLWFLMQHLRRSARRRAQQEEEDQPSSSSDSDGGSDDSDNPPEPVQCVPQ